MEVRHLALLLFTVLCVTLSVKAQSAEVQRRYKHFLNQHVFGGMNPNRCDAVIRDRRITVSNTNNCKETNTFILATHEQVRAICQNGGRPRGGNLYESTKPFTIVTCRLRSGERRPRCEYRGTSSTRTITVGCDANWPVHYEEDRIVGR